MFEETNPWLAGGGLALGLAFGIVAQRSRFCVVAAISNLALMRDFRYLHAYLAALGVAVVGTFALEWAQLVAIADTGFRRPALNWLGALGGGLLFGVGAMLAGGCASRTLIRSAEGNLGAFLTLMAFALAGMATLFGALDPIRGWVLAQALPLKTSDASLSAILDWPAWVLPLGLGLACFAVILRPGPFRENRGTLVAGMLIGLMVVAGWWITGVLGTDDFDPRPPSSLAMAAPLARSTAWFSMGQPTGTEFALALIPGTLLGGFAAAVVSGEFRWVAPASGRVAAYLGGGGLMGFGAVLAGGCNIGQGLTGIATLSVTSLLAVVATLVGMSLGFFWVSRSST